ncbi:MAG: DUF1844 domain-containing protein [bacterium]|nr:MAG: DUF1844 domain-containing protein [bacterium]
MNDDTTSGGSHNAFLFQHLIAMFQTLALQQLGKLVSPITGKLERDLQQARITIDMLQMIKDKTAGNLTGDEQSLLDHVLWELQINFVDEQQRSQKEREEAEVGGEQPEAAAEEAASGEGQADKPSAAGPVEKDATSAGPTTTGARKRGKAKAKSKRASTKRSTKKKKE